MGETSLFHNLNVKIILLVINDGVINTKAGRQGRAPLTGAH